MTPCSPYALCAHKNGRPNPTPRAPNALAIKTSLPRRIPPSMYISISFARFGSSACICRKASKAVRVLFNICQPCKGNKRSRSLVQLTASMVRKDDAGQSVLLGEADVFNTCHAFEVDRCPLCQLLQSRHVVPIQPWVMIRGEVGMSAHSDAGRTIVGSALDFLILPAGRLVLLPRLISCTYFLAVT
jgi:hypothetical protein